MVLNQKRVFMPLKKSKMRELVIERIKQKIDWVNEQNSWRDSFIQVKYPNFDERSDEELLAVFEGVPSGPLK
jgi:hypothetical protein